MIDVLLLVNEKEVAHIVLPTAPEKGDEIIVYGLANTVDLYKVVGRMFWAYNITEMPTKYTNGLCVYVEEMGLSYNGDNSDNQNLGSRISQMCS